MIKAIDTSLQIFTVLHHFGELTAFGKKPDMVYETADSVNLPSYFTLSD